MENQSLSDTSQDTVFRQLEQYDWEKDREFQGGLSAILGPSPSPSQLQDLTLRAQCFYFSRKKKIPIDFDAYKEYLSRSQNTSQSLSSEPTSSPSHHQVPPQPTPQKPQSTSSSSLPWQISHSTTPSTQPLSIQPQHPPAFTPPPNPNPAHAPYPATFNEIVALIQAGEPVPGIEDIDPTIAWGKGSKPSRRAQRKPWEKNLSEEEIQPGSRGGTFADERDRFIVQELPDDEEPQFKGANWWKVLEEREREREKKEKEEVGDAAAGN